MFRPKGGETITNGTMSQTMSSSANTAATSTAGNVAFAVNNSAGTPTANLQNWQANSATVANVTPAGAFNSTVGYQVSGAATSGNYLRGNGTNFVSNTIQASDLPAVPLSGLATQATNTVVMNATGGTAVPTAMAMPTCTTGADLYNTTTRHAGPAFR